MLHIISYNTYKDTNLIQTYINFISTYSKLYESCITPILEYFAGIWGSSKFECITKIYQRAIRYYLGVPKNTACAGLEAEMSWLKPKYRQFISVVRLYNRYITMQNNRLVKYVFLVNIVQHNPWYTDFLKILQLVGYDKPGNLQTTINLKVFKNLCSGVQDTKLKFQMTQKPKLKHFLHYKCKKVGCVEPYVMLHNKKCRSNFATYRLGSLKLLIETGHYEGLRHEDRICTFCNLNKIEDEVHFLCECPLYEVLRAALYSEINSEQFKNLVLDCWNIRQAQTLN